MTQPNASGLKRAFADADKGQIHYWRGSIRDDIPLVMLHGSPGSSYSLLPYGEHLAQTRDVILIDTPGNGDSTAPASEEPTIPELASLISQALSDIGLSQYYLYGFHTGASIAISLASEAETRVRKLILEGISFFSAEDRASLMQNDHAPAIGLDTSGAHLAQVWDMIRNAHIYWPWWNTTAAGFRNRDLPDARYLHFEALQIFKSIETYHLSYRAAIGFDKKERLSKIKVPVLATCSPKDQLRKYLEATSEYCRAAIIKEIPGIDTPADQAASCQVFDDFLNAPED